jgi:hypothetical protein
MKVSIHQKHLSCNIQNTYDYLKTKSMHTKTNSTVTLKNLKTSRNLKQSQSDMIKNNSTGSLFGSGHKLIRNKKLIIENQLKLPKLDYLVTGYKAPTISSIENNIKNKIKIIRRESGIDTINIERILQKEKDDRRRKSLICYEPAFEDEDIEDIMNVDPSNVLSQRKGYTIHQIVRKIIEQEKGINDDYEEEDVKKQLDMQNIKTQLMEIHNAPKERRASIVDSLHHNIRKEKYSNSRYYKTVKDAKTQLIQKKILNNKDCSVFSKLYLLNNNPLFTINNKISYQYTLSDSGLLANLYNVNLYRLKNVKGNRIMN